MIVSNCVGSGVHAIITPGLDTARCPECDALWPSDSLNGGKVPAHPPIKAALSNRVHRFTEPELLDIEAAEKASRREG